MLIDEVWLTLPMVNELGDQLGVHRTTVSRWICKGELPQAIALLLALIKNGDLAKIHSAWSGWKLDPKTGRLLPPNGDPAFLPGHLYAMQLKYQQISALTHQVADLREQLLAAGVDAGVKPISENGQTDRGCCSAYHEASNASQYDGQPTVFFPA